MHIDLVISSKGLNLYQTFPILKITLTQRYRIFNVHKIETTRSNKKFEKTNTYKASIDWIFYESK